VTFDDARLPARFWAKVKVDTATGCWLWQGATNPQGYGQIRLNGRLEYAHRVVLGLAGVRTPGRPVDHLCRTAPCCNPFHLEHTTQRENALRGNTKLNGANHRRKTHCPTGHPYDVVNTYLHRGSRHCRTCWSLP
jgi:hypothetical protein